ncbi:MAG: tetratricopeptide repeat protein [Thermodesulfobacteriota bacterium]|nr:tetratricopeptide repeat protein [Thermodesulfobacteriota bacterium]
MGVKDAIAFIERGDYENAYRIIKPLAEEGDAHAQCILAAMYFNGQGFPQDYTAAAKWFQRAAEQGYAEAQHNLALLYKVGQGVPQVNIFAHMWFNIAASQLDIPTATRVVVVKERDLVASRMTPEQIARANKLAWEWRPKKEGK